MEFGFTANKREKKTNRDGKKQRQQNELYNTLGRPLNW